eukprot:scaffold2000_cov156-Amphora_coffeaeformis.AAC.2
MMQANQMIRSPARAANAPSGIVVPMIPLEVAQEAIEVLEARLQLKDGIIRDQDIHIRQLCDNSHYWIWAGIFWFISVTGSVIVHEVPKPVSLSLIAISSLVLYYFGLSKEW